MFGGKVLVFTTTFLSGLFAHLQGLTHVCMMNVVFNL